MHPVSLRPVLTHRHGITVETIDEISSIVGFVGEERSLLPQNLILSTLNKRAGLPIEIPIFIRYRNVPSEGPQLHNGT